MAEGQSFCTCHRQGLEAPKIQMLYQTTIPNFAAVDEPNRIFRGGQPVTDDDWDFIRSLGVQRVIKLNEDAEGSDDGALATGLTLFKCQIGWSEQVITEPDPQYLVDAVGFIIPGTFIHCEHGQDRTGLVVGLFRLKQGWLKERAYTEMKNYGFHPLLFGLGKAWANA